MRVRQRSVAQRCFFSFLSNPFFTSSLQRRPLTATPQGTHSSPLFLFLFSPSPPLPSPYLLLSPLLFSPPPPLHLLLSSSSPLLLSSSLSPLRLAHSRHA